MTNKEKLKESIRRIKNELQERILYFKENDKPLEAERIQMRTKYDLEMLEEMGGCPGVENYARHIALKEAGETPSTLIDFFNKDFMLIIDESHVTVSQVRGMYNGDRSRKMTLVDYGFRLPSALDNRPLKFDEFESKLDNVIYLSATPGDYELNRNLPIIEQIIRPTYLVDPEIEVRKSFGQIDDLYAEIVKRVALNERVLVTTLTIKMSEDLTAYFKKLGMKVAYLHSEIKSLERIVILRDLRIGKYDVLVGINLLREGLDLPEVSLVAILDADKQGFLRSERSLIQTIGRAARNLNGKVIMYADHVSESMEKAIQDTNRRRSIQLAFNEKYGTKPVSIKKDIRDDISMKEDIDELPMKKRLTAKDLDKAIARIERDMKQAAKELNFELATELRDQLFELKAERGYLNEL
jgi:excinuclease ABC subunit B